MQAFHCRPLLQGLPGGARAASAGGAPCVPAGRELWGPAEHCSCSPQTRSGGQVGLTVVMVVVGDVVVIMVGNVSGLGRRQACTRMVSKQAAQWCHPIGTGAASALSFLLL